VRFIKVEKREECSHLNQHVVGCRYYCRLLKNLCPGPDSPDCPLEGMAPADTEWSWSQVERDIVEPPAGHNPDTVYLSKVVLESEAKQKLAVKDMFISHLIELLVKERERSMHYRCNIGEEEGLCDGKCEGCEDNEKNARARVDAELKEILKRGD